jgi:hypothetical protein
MAKTKTRYYMVVLVNDSTGSHEDMFDKIMTHKEAVTALSKQSHGKLPKNKRFKLEERRKGTKLS